MFDAGAAITQAGRNKYLMSRVAIYVAFRPTAGIFKSVLQLNSILFRLIP
jgi:hypothetical protein